jgi:hypothetical protein
VPGQQEDPIHVIRLTTSGVLPAASAAGTGESLRLPIPNLQVIPAIMIRNLLLAFCSTVITLLLAELAIGFVVGSGSPPPAAAVGRDVRTRLEVIQELNGRGVRATADLHGRVIAAGKADGHALSLAIDGTTAVPLSPSVSGSTVVLCNEAGEWIRYESDEAGFRNPAGTWDGRTVDLLTLGDSYTLGVCQPDSLTFVGVLRGVQPSLANVGLAGTGPFTQMAILREYGAELRPRLVLWFFYEGNDFADIAAEREHPLLARYADAAFHQNLRAHQHAVDDQLGGFLGRVTASAAARGDRPPARRQAHRKVIRTLKLTNVRTLAGVSRGYRPSTETVDAYSDIVAGVKHSVESWGGEVMIVYLPTYNRFARRGSGEAFQGRDVVMSVARKHDIAVVDVAAAFGRSAEPLRFWTHGQAHYTEEGNRLVANTVVDALQRHAAGALHAR